MVYWACYPYAKVINMQAEMEEKPALGEWEPSDLDFVSTSNFSLQCSIGSHTTNAKFEWVDYRPAVFRFVLTLQITSFFYRFLTNILISY